MIYIVDGPNNVGKTSYINKVVKRQTGYDEVDHITKNATFEAFSDLLNRDNIILDRGPISELVYSKIYGRQSNLTEEECKQLLDSKKIYCEIMLSVLDIIKEHYKSKGETNSDEYNDDFILKELELFSDYANKFNCNITWVV